MNDSADNPSSPPALPDLHQAMLTPETLESLRRDLCECAEVLEVIPKYGAQAHVPEHPGISLEQGCQMLQSGELRGLQIRYRYQEADWWDTLMKTPAGIRLVRIRHDAGTAH